MVLELILCDLALESYGLFSNDIATKTHEIDVSAMVIDKRACGSKGTTHSTTY